MYSISIKMILFLRLHTKIRKSAVWEHGALKKKGHRHSVLTFFLCGHFASSLLHVVHMWCVSIDSQSIFTANMDRENKAVYILPRKPPRKSCLPRLDNYIPYRR